MKKASDLRPRLCAFFVLRVLKEHRPIGVASGSDRIRFERSLPLPE